MHHTKFVEFSYKILYSIFSVHNLIATEKIFTFLWIVKVN